MKKSKHLIKKKVATIIKQQKILPAAIFLLLLAIAVASIFYFKYFADTIANPKYFGCQNLQNNDSKCLHFINNNENNITIDPVSNLGEISGTFRPILGGKAVTVKVPAFNVDSQGFPTSDMMLEIKYKDTIAAGFSGTTQVFQEIDYGTTTYPSVPALSLGKTGKGDTLIKQALFEKNQWQRLRAIKGQFVFRIVGGSSDLPIEYIALQKIDHSDAEAFKKWQRSDRGFKEVEYREKNPKLSVKDMKGDFALYASSTTKQIFPNSIPIASELDRDINLFSALGEYEPIPISIYTQNELKNVTVSISDLSGQEDKISKDNVEVRKVVYDYKRWPNLGYGIQPDRIEKFDNINVPANTSQQFWLTVSVPKTISGGVYSGTITFKADGRQTKSVKIGIDILPMELKDTKQVNAVYFDPQNRTYSLNNSAVFKDMREHEINSTIDSTKIKVNFTNGVVSLDSSELKTRLKTSVDQGIVKDTILYSVYSLRSTILYQLNSFYKSKGDANLTINGEVIPNTPRWQDYGSLDDLTDLATNWKKVSDPRFKKIFELAVKQMISDGKSIKSENGTIKMLFTDVDEPAAKKADRAYSDRIYRYIKEAGGETWVTYHNVCKNEVECPECQPCAECTVKDGKTYLPALTNLIDNKLYAMYDITDSNVKADQNSFGLYDTYYSQLRDPVSNRFIHGLFAEKSGAKTTAIYTYGGFSDDPYNDFDSEDFYNYPDFLLAYPTWNPDGEVIPTMGWEALREGIKDSKYIEALKDLIAKYPNTKKAKEANAYLNTLMSKISLDWKNNYHSKLDPSFAGFDKNILKTISTSGSGSDYAAFDDMRNTVIQFIKDISNASRITIPADNLQTGLNMVSFPNTTNLDASNLSQFGTLVEFDFNTGSYTKPTKVSAGLGYWLWIDKNSKPNKITYETNADNAGSPMSVAVSKPGWIFLGNPTASEYPITKISVHFKNGSTKTFDQATDSRSIYGYAYSYESDGYHFITNHPEKYKNSLPKQTTIKPFKGFSLYILDSNIDQVILNP